MTTLDEAVATGQGIERPFRCHMHEDNQASASVNVLKGVWVCFACRASGTVDGKKAPRLEELAAMLEPEKSCRVYPDAYLELFNDPFYWETRFPAWVCQAMGLGEDPFTGDATFPVHTPGGLLAGVGRRHIEEDTGPRYLYPKRWSASTTLFGTRGRYPALPVLVLVEGAADATSCWEVGAPGLAVYGSGVHLPQRDLLARYNPRLILQGFDMDDAGERATTGAFRTLANIAPMARVRWPEKDPGECSPAQRLGALVSAVRRAGYGESVISRWEANVGAMKADYARYVEERDGR